MNFKMKKKLNFVFDYFLSGGTLPVGLSPKSIAEIYHLHTSKYYTGELKNDYQGDFARNHVKTSCKVKIGPFFDWDYKDSFEVNFASVNDISDRDPNISFGGNGKYICVLEPAARWISLFDSASNNLFSNISTKLLLLLQSRNTILVINYMGEALCDYDREFPILYEKCLKYNIPLENIILISGDYDINKQFENWYEKSLYKNKNPKINIWKSIHLLECASKSYRDYSLNRNIEKNEFGYISSDFTKEDAIELKDTNRKKYFLSMNGNVSSGAKQHRQIVGGFYIKENLLDKGLVSFGELKTKDVPLRSHLIHNRTEYKKLLPYIRQMAKKSPMQLDIRDKDKFKNSNFTATNLDFTQNYKDTYFSIVSESNFVQNTFITAATVKCFGNLHPFIALSTYKFLDKLKELGFKTFHPFIDESYDEIKNNEERIFAILNEIKRLCSKPKKELHDWYYSILDDILVYNKEVLLEIAKSSERHNFFEKLYEIINE